MRAITDEDGNVVNRYDYDAFGNMTQACPMMDGSVPAAERKPCIPNRYTYTGREWDADAQLYHYRARWYDPSIQRFISEDMEFEINLYIYAYNNSIVITDPSGNIPQAAAAAVLIVIAAAAIVSRTAGNIVTANRRKKCPPGSVRTVEDTTTTYEFGGSKPEVDTTDTQYIPTRTKQQTHQREEMCPRESYGDIHQTPGADGPFVPGR